jgi:hypothetical protein
MTHLMRWIRHLGQLSCTLLTLLGNGVCYFTLRLRSPAALTAENLFLRKQLALYRERSITPRRATHATRLTLVWLARCFDWRRTLVIVRPATLIGWHRHKPRHDFLDACAELARLYPVDIRSTGNHAA